MSRACFALSQNGVGNAHCVSLVDILACVWRRNRFCVIHETRRVGKVSGERSNFGEVVRRVCCGIFGELCSESSTISGIEPDLKGYLVESFETVVPESVSRSASFAMQKQQQLFPLGMRFLFVRSLQ